MKRRYFVLGGLGGVSMLPAYPVTLSATAPAQSAEAAPADTPAFSGEASPWPGAKARSGTGARPGAAGSDGSSTGAPGSPDRAGRDMVEADIGAVQAALIRQEVSGQ